ncbi:MAG TPA: hypothetical protein P5136_00060 [Methanofastidiosum sp.]|nr:hypothetical protein [Methanofastidiosum sp.]
MNTQNFIKSIIEEKDGFQLDEAWRVNEDSLGVVVPVKRDIKEDRDYITFAEAKDVKVEDTGMIDHVYVKNNEAKPLLISRGEIFRGKTQERAAVHGHIVMPGKGLRVAVRCIHATKGIQRGAEMKYGGRVPFEVQSNLGDQSSTWRSVKAHNTSYYGEDIKRNPARRFYDPTTDILLKSVDSGATFTGMGGSHTTSMTPPAAGQPTEQPKEQFLTGVYKGENVYTSNISGVTFNSKGMPINVNEDEIDPITSRDILMVDKIPIEGEPLGEVADNSITFDALNLNSVNYLHQECNVGAADDMVGALDSITQQIKEAMKKLPPIENQVGAIFLFENEFQGMDIYNLPDSWKTVKEDTVAKEGSSFIKKDDTSIFEFKPERVKALIGKELAGTFEEKVIYGEKQGEEYKIIELREIIDTAKKKKRIIGEAVEFRDKIIHLTLSRV